MTDLSACPIPTILESAAVRGRRPPLARPLAITLEGHKTRLTSAAPALARPRSATELFIIGVRTWLAAGIPFRTVPGMYAVLFHVALDFRESHKCETVPRAAITVTRLFGLRFGRMTMK